MSWVGRFVALPCLSALLCAPLSGQQAAAVLTGRVVDASGPVLAADLVLTLDDDEVARGETDADGTFRIEAPPARYTLRVTRLGYAEDVRLVTLTAGAPVELAIQLRPAAVLLEGVGVEAERSRERLRFEETAGASVREITSDELKLVPGIGEADPIRAVEVLPGVVSTSDFSSSFHVRGGSADQNLILLDGTPIFSPFHLGGFFSVFNADMVSRAELASGGFEARYGGRVSSVLSVESDPGDGAFAVDGGVSLLATRVAVSGGAGDRDVRWRVSGRRSYFDKLLAPVAEFPYHLQDLQAVAEVGLSLRDRLRFTAYTGDDVLDFSQLEDEDFPLRIDWSWGNDVVGLRWDRSLDRGRLSARASYTRFSTSLTFPDFGDTDFRSRISQRSFGVDWNLRPLPLLEIGAGAGVDDFGFDNLASTGGTVFSEGLGTGTQYGGYLQTVWGRPGTWLVEAGARIDHWVPAPGEPITEVSPRLAVKRFLGGSSRWAINASAGRYTQFLHSLRDEELPLGLDIWVLTGERTPHVVSDQLQVGIEAFPNDEWTFSAEAYVRTFDGVLTFNTTDDPNDDFDDVLVGDGLSWGADLFVRRSGTPVNGWISASFLKADRTFPDLYAGTVERPEVTYAPIFDRRLDLDLVLRFPAPRGWEGGLRLNVGTGTPYTRPVASYAAYQPRFLKDGGRAGWAGDSDDDFAGYAVLLGERNAERYPVYHRLDVSFRRDYQKSWGVLTPHVDLLNVYNQKNVLFYFYDYETTPAVRSGISMFPFLPTIGLEVRF
ncbi:carboxypeptidase regulatory-like domain-containing protein [Gaopeijia maritima]|uniref:TonB-dependent receptor n=1 Tax=Gaopeijia maritima TaxID=3119007 RepID=UPI003249DD13